MRRVGTEAWAGLAMLVVSVGVTAPMLFGMAQPLILRGMWIALLGLFLASIVVATAGIGPKALHYTGYAVSVAAAWVLVSTAPGMGLVLILLVVTATTSVYLAPLWVGLIVAGVNSALIAVLSFGRDAGDGEAVMITGFYLMIQVASVLSSATLVREQRLRRDLTAANVELQAAAVLLSESARTSERLRISRELHDTLGHRLTVLTLEIENARHQNSAGARGHLDRADRVARELLHDVRTTVGQLRTQPPDLERALNQIANAAPGLDVTIEVSPSLRVNDDEAAALVRAAQEITTNSLRHADARHLSITVSASDDAIELNAVDDGKGANAITMGNGLRGLVERFAELGGELIVDGSVGFRVAGRIPR